MICSECGEEMFIADGGTSHHESDIEPTGIDHDADADHTPYSED